MGNDASSEYSDDTKAAFKNMKYPLMRSPSGNREVINYDKVTEEALQRFQELISSGGWEPMKDGMEQKEDMKFGDITCEIKTVSVSQIPVARASMIVKLPVENVLPAIALDRVILDYGEQVFGVSKTIEYHSPVTDIVHVKGKDVFKPLADPRDCVIACTWKKNADGVWQWVAVSVPHERAPNLKDNKFIRANLHIGGYQLEPLESNPEYTKLTAILLLDAKGQLDLWVKKLVNKGVPILMERLGAMMTDLKKMRKYTKVWMKTRVKVLQSFGIEMALSGKEEDARKDIALLAGATLDKSAWRRDAPKEPQASASVEKAATIDAPAIDEAAPCVLQDVAE